MSIKKTKLKFSTELSTVMPKVTAKTSNETWQRWREQETLRTFHMAAQIVPAYKDFLKKNKIQASKVKTLADFELVPPTSKENYLNAYSMDKLVKGGTLKRPMTIVATSGSTGDATYFHRVMGEDLDRHEVMYGIYKNNPQTLRGPTLVIGTFTMGSWSSGMSTYTNVYMVANIKGAPVSIITPGMKKDEVLIILKKLAPLYKQVIMMGYPPFLKDVIDSAIYAGIDLKPFNLRLYFAGEGYPEELRDYFVEVGKVRHVYTDIINSYGSSELGIMGIETPLTIMIRRLKNKGLNQALFHQENLLPTLTQFNPFMANFNEENGNLYFTGDRILPLIKYASGDIGGIISYGQLEDCFSANGLSLEQLKRKTSYSRLMDRAPMVFTRERPSLAAVFEGVRIYPESIRAVVLNKELRQFLTGKFILSVKKNSQGNRYLHLAMELMRDVTLTIDQQKAFQQRIVTGLGEIQPEYKALESRLGNGAHPEIWYGPYEDKTFIQTGTKHKWIGEVL